MRHVHRAPSIPKQQRIDVTREEFDQLIDLLNERAEIMNTVIHNQDVQMRRIAQMQAVLDRLVGTLDRLKLT